MNSLPPELLSSIVDLAADCSSIYESWDTRMNTLLSLTLVNKTFHEIAQPHLPQKFFFKEDVDVAGKFFEELTRSRVTAKIKNLTLKPKSKTYPYALPKLLGFENLTELRVQCYSYVMLENFKAHHHLSRVTFYGGYLRLHPDTDAEIALRSLIEVTLETVVLVVDGPRKAGATSPLLSESHFPCLRALGLKNFFRFEDVSRAVFSDALIARLDCLTTDDTSIPNVTRNLPVPVPHLLDIRFEESLNDDMSYSLVFASPSPSHTHLRIRLPFELVSSYRDINSALEFANNLVKESTNLEELYLDLYPRDGRRGYVLEKELEEKIKKVEETAREKNVEIIWENHEDDWCESRVSKEFWKRCKAKKEKELREG